MVYEGEKHCPICAGELRSYGHVHRTIRGKEGKKETITIRRLRCVKCHTVHRELPKRAIPHLYYDRNIIVGVSNGWITPETLGFEDYPCEATMNRWQRLHFQPDLF